MTKTVINALAGLALLVLSACASMGLGQGGGGVGPIIAKPSEIYSTWNWNKDIEAGVIDGGHKEEMEAIKAHSTEKGWPEKLADYNTRIKNPEIIQQYKGEVIATFKNGDTPVAVVRVPAKQNTHMPDGWKPAEDIFIVIKQEGLAPK